MQPKTDEAPFARRSPLGAFLKSEAAGGVLLMISAALALIIANSPVAPLYFATLGSYVAGLSILHWINDALMAVFFLLVGLEIKRELLEGQLSTWSRRALPGIAALGGMVVPALIFLALTRGDPVAMRGWAIPAATDIAFALGVLALLGSRVPVSLKIFLTALAILDDLGAVIIIALFYTKGLSLPMLGLAGACIVGLIVLNRLHVTKLWAYLGLGALLWFFVLKSGVHATLAGVALALTIPIGDGSDSDEPEHSPLHTLEHWLHPYVAFLIVPIFGFANAGVSFTGMTPASALAPVPLGIALGLFLGKQIGVFGFSWLAIRAGLAAMPAQANTLQLYGVALLCGIGFTMSLFIGALAFDSPELGKATKIGVLLGSIASAVLGAIVLRMAGRRQAAERPAE
ncbi:Na+/H+ antiporter NhaA [Bosea sp. (in: a-proteobacteria)]|jgi:NhaA family Na+:H+ antiporter|uniref:Na+/H+ antiporter NhaA n=1 Tax=Bosea sp. (in: a-proteobacteria) TaxID=1871050 RepID=UPI002B46750B|nr:Na+/H+ antiporter NhaA [Bosea sp. (in: a-proteobacteria)]WRH58579.1 MAG: Na+/H+ antiporter NhaA [Bosea sp. (in: a-proteobacteria)]